MIALNITLIVMVPKSIQIECDDHTQTVLFSEESLWDASAGVLDKKKKLREAH